MVTGKIIRNCISQPCIAHHTILTALVLSTAISPIAAMADTPPASATEINVANYTDNNGILKIGPISGTYSINTDNSNDQTIKHSYVIGKGEGNALTLNITNNNPFGFNSISNVNIDLQNNTILNLYDGAQLGSHLLSLYNSALIFNGNTSDAASSISINIGKDVVHNYQMDGVVLPLDGNNKSSGPASYIDLSNATGSTIKIGGVGGTGNIYLGSKTLELGNQYITAPRIIAGAILNTNHDGQNGGGGALIINTGQGIVTDPNTGNNVIDPNTGKTELKNVSITLTNPDNNYTGATTVESGTLALSGKGSIASSSGVAISSGAVFDISASDPSVNVKIQNLTGDSGSVVTLGANTLNITNANGSFAGNIGQGGDTGGVSITGNLTLSGQNEYRGDTTLSDTSTLKLTGSGSISNSGVVMNSGNSIFDISGINNTSVENLTGNNENATVKLGSNTLSLTGSTGNRQAGTFAGVIAGGGGLTLGAGHTETLTGTNTYTGVTTIGNNAILNIGDGGTNGTVSHTSSFANSGTINFNHSDDLTVNREISGSGGITQSGSDVLTLSGTNTYSGSTLVNNGVLNVTGDSSGLSGTTSVNNNAILTGTGSIGGNVNINEGKLVAGSVSSDGGQQLNTTINGSLTLSPHSIVSIAGNATKTGAIITDSGKSASYNLLQSDKIKVGGTAHLDGTLNMIMNNQQALTYGEAYRVLTAKQGTGGTTLKALTTNLSYEYLKPVLSYNKNSDGSEDVDIILERNGTSFAQSGTTANQKGTGKALDSISHTSPLYTAIVGIGGGQARHTLDSMSGEVHASVRTALIQDSFFIRNATLNRMANFECDYGRNGQSTFDTTTAKKNQSCDNNHTVIWGQAYGGIGSNGGNGNFASMHDDTTGFVMGADTPITNSNWRIGGMLGYGRSMFGVNQRSSSGNSNNISVGTYAGSHWGHVNLRLGATYTWNVIKTRRMISLGDYSGRASAGYLGGTAQAFAELGYRMHFAKKTVFEPFANVSYVNLQTNSFKEHGNIAALRGRGMDTGVTMSSFGFRASSQFKIGKALFVPHATAYYRHTFGNLGGKANMSFINGGENMGVNGVMLAEDSAVIDTGITARVNERIDVDLSYVGQYGTRFMNNGATGGVKVRF